MDNEFSMSVPQDRDINTMSLNPRLASQAPKVNRMTLILALGAFIVASEIGTNSTSLNVIPSRDSRVIRKCD